MQKKIQELIGEASYIAVTCDESTAVDNTSWLCLHVYVMQNWSRRPLLLTLQKLDSDGYTADSLLAVITGILAHHGKMEPDGYIADSLLAVITGILAHHGKMEPDEIAAKLICFGGDGVSSFQGCRNGVSKQLLENWCPFVL